MKKNDSIQAWIPPQIDEMSSKIANNYQEVVLSNQLKQDGFNKGYQEGLMKADQEFQQQKENLSKIVIELNKAKIEFVKNSENVLSEIVLLIAKKVITHELTINKLQISNIFKEMLTKKPDTNKPIIIKVNPDDIAIIKKITESQPNENFEIFADADVSIGSIIMKSDFTRQEYNIDEIFNSIVEKACT